MSKQSRYAVRLWQAVLGIALFLQPSTYPYDDGEGIVTIGTEATPTDPTAASTGTINVGADASAAFNMAINDAAYLGGNGGTIVVLPGQYVFQSAVVVPAGVTIEGSRGAVLRPAPLTTESIGIFDVQGDGFVLNGLAHSRPSPTPRTPYPRRTRSCPASATPTTTA